jgi:hypothetical protein
MEKKLWKKKYGKKNKQTIICKSHVFFPHFSTILLLNRL